MIYGTTNPLTILLQRSGFSRETSTYIRQHRDECSIVSPEDDNTVQPGVKEKRKNAKVDENHILQENVLFSSPSSAAMFVIGKSANGWTSWKTKDGKTLHDLEDKE